MTIYQLPQPCWATDPASLDGDDERQPHYDTEAGALRDIADAREENPGLKAGARQLDAPCWVVQCDGECETVLDTEDEGWTFHHDSRADAGTTAAAYGFRYAGDSVFCREDAPGDAPLLLSPAEREAAGQLPLPGVIP
jgi:hypothetical protein